MTNLEIVQTMYQAFGRGDVKTLLSAMDPQVEWSNPGPSSPAYFGTHRGPEAIARNIFGFLAENLQFEVFAPTHFFAEGDKVVVLLDMVAVAKKSARRITQKAVHVFTFRAGKLTHFQDFQDSYTLADALSQTS
jgi:ketosteroid isomerase-like protein